MERLLAVPLRAQNTVEHTLLHAVLCPYTQNIAHPNTRYVQRESAQNESTHKPHRSIQRAIGRPRSHVDGMLNGPNLSQRHAYRPQPDKRIERGLQSVAVPSVPEPMQKPTQVHSGECI